MLITTTEQESADVLILDMSGLFYRAYCKIEFENENGVDLSGLVGSLSTIQSQIRKHKPTIVVAVFDGKGGSKKKKKIFPEYKEGRSIPIKVSKFVRPNEIEGERIKAKENFLYQMRLLNEFLVALPIHRVIVEGYEADEIIAYISQKYFNEFTRVIVSGDKDFQQLITPTCKQFYLHEKKTLGLDYLEAKWGTRLGNIVTILRCIDGDDSDKIWGLHGYGFKTINKYFPLLATNENIKTPDDLKLFLEETIKQCKETKQPKNYKTVIAKAEHILEGVDKQHPMNCWDIIERNFKLMQLFEPDINFEAKKRIFDTLTQEVKFNSIDYKRRVIQEGIDISARSLEVWESTYKELEFSQHQASNKLKQLIGVQENDI